jgi:hypothetical protein
MIETMIKFKDCTFASLQGDKIVATYDGNTLSVSFEGEEIEVELKGIQIDNWYEKGELRIKLDEDAIFVSHSSKGFPVNAVKYYRMD